MAYFNNRLERFSDKSSWDGRRGLRIIGTLPGYEGRKGRTRTCTGSAKRCSSFSTSRLGLDSAEW